MLYKDHLIRVYRDRGKESTRRSNANYNRGNITVKMNLHNYSRLVQSSRRLNDGGRRKYAALVVCRNSIPGLSQ